MNILEFKSHLTKELCIRLLLPAQEAVSGQIISVALGQHGVKTQEFIKEFNDITKKFSKGLFVCLLVFVKLDGSFKIEIKGLSILFLLKLFINEENSFILFKDLLLIAEILKQNRFVKFKQINYLSLLKSLKGSLISRNIKIKF